MSGHELVDHYSEHLQRVGRILRHYRELYAQAERARDRVRMELAAARDDLAIAYLPDLTAEALADVASRAEFKKLQRRDPIQAMNHEKQVLERRIAEIEGDERWQRRQWLVGAHGEWTRELAEAQSLLAPWEEACARFEDQKHFLTLVELGYDTPDYGVSFLEARYWTFWASGDRICRELDMADFGDDVLPAYREVEAERAKWRAVVAEIQGRIDALHDLVRERDQAEARIPRLPEIYLQACQKAVAEFVGMADHQLLAQWNDAHREPNREVMLGLRRLSGLAAKLEALQDLMNTGIKPFIADMEARQAKFRRKATKFARPKHYRARHPHRYGDHKFGPKSDKYLLRADQALKLVRRLSEYDDYARFDLAHNAPELWFREMTGKRPSRLFPVYRKWYERQPGMRPKRAPKASSSSSAKAAVRASRSDDLGYLS